MADSKAAVKQALKEAANVCKTSLALLPQRHSEGSFASSSATKITPIHQSLPPIFVDLLQSIRTHVTSTSLSFSPPITPDGALSYLPKAQDAVARLVSCVVAAAGDDKLSARESILVEDWANASRRVIEGMLALLQAYAEHMEQPASWTKASKTAEKTLPDVKQAAAPYLSHTASVWDIIDTSLKAITGTEAEAAQRRWALDSDSMTDAWTEYTELLKDAEEAGDDASDEEEDLADDEEDEWAGLEKDLMGGGKLSKEEIARAKSAKPILQLTRLMHRSVPKALSSHPFSFRPLLISSNKLSADYDNAVATLYSPQHTGETRYAFDELVEASIAVAAHFDNDDSLESAIAGLSVSDVAVADRKKVCDFLAKWRPKLEETHNDWLTV